MVDGKIKLANLHESQCGQEQKKYKRPL